MWRALTTECDISQVESLGPVQKQVRDLEPRPSGSGFDTPLPDERGSTDLYLDRF